MTTPLAIFDMDNTLLDREAAMRRWSQLLVERHGLGPGEAEWIVEADGDGYAPRLPFVGALVQRYGLRVTAEQLLTEYRAQIVELIEPYPGTAAALAGLRTAGWRLAIATNGLNVQQRRKATATGLDGLVDAIVVSEEAGAGKPDARVFHLVAARLGVELTAADWMVGDCPTRDVGGARTLGLRTVWMRRGRSWDATLPVPDAIVDTVPEAAQALLGAG